MCENIQDTCNQKFKRIDEKIKDGFTNVYGELDEMKGYMDKKFDKMDSMFEKYIDDFQTVKEAIVGIDTSNKYIADSLKSLEKKTEKQQEQINQTTNDITMIKTIVQKEPLHKKILENLSNNKLFWALIIGFATLIFNIPWDKIVEVIK